jgi:N-acetylglutamate synthase-like GNAT family acetyltransferase
MVVLKRESQMGVDEQLWLRPGRPEDRSALLELLEQFGVQGEITPSECLVAEGPQGIMGFARLEIFDEAAYLRPIVIASQYQRQGIGRRLVLESLSQVCELRVVARGEAVKFYTHLGFKPVGWTLIPPAFRRECDFCPDFSACQPVPMACLGEETTIRKY